MVSKPKRLYHVRVYSQRAWHSRLFFCFTTQISLRSKQKKGGKSKIIFFNIQFAKIFSKSQKWDISPCKI